MNKLIIFLRPSLTQFSPEVEEARTNNDMLLKIYNSTAIHLFLSDYYSNEFSILTNYINPNGQFSVLVVPLSWLNPNPYRGGAYAPLLFSAYKARS